MNSYWVIVEEGEPAHIVASGKELEAARKELIRDRRTVLDYSEKEDGSLIMFYPSTGGGPHSISAANLDNHLYFFGLLQQYKPDEDLVKIVPCDPHDVVHQVLLEDRLREAM